MSTNQSIGSRFRTTPLAVVMSAAAWLLAFNPSSATAADDYGAIFCSDQGSDPCCCGEPTCERCCSCRFGHCTGVWGDFLLLHATDADVAHAQQQNGTGGAGTVPFGTIAVVDPAYEPGFRVGGTIGLSPCSSLSVAYTFYESDSLSYLEAPVIPGGGGAIGSLVHHPGAGIVSSAGPLQASYGIDFQLAEFEYRALLCGDECGWINYSVGARYANLEQDFFQTGLFSGSQAGVLDTRTSSEFDGGGALFGLDGERRLGDGRFSLYGNAGVSPIVGQFTTSYSMNNSSTSTLLAEALWKDDRFVTILEFEVGLAWTSCNGCIRASAGYLAQSWYNVITTSELIDAVQANNYTDASETLSFDGLATRIEVRF